MFYLYQSNRLESLAALFCKLQQVNPPKQPLAAEEIVVQSQGMRRYLSSHLARELGVAANLKFSLPAGLAWQLMRKTMPEVPPMSPFAPEVIRWRLLDLFRSERFQTASEFAEIRAALQDYAGSSQSADYQLAGQLADIFDQYLVYRPDWIDGWQVGKLFDLGDDEIWQAALWRYLSDGQTVPNRVALWETLLKKLSEDVLPERLFVFGISTMAPMYLELLNKISNYCDVYMFALNPSAHYWGNVLEPAQILASGDTDLNLSGHPLLASLGKQGRDFFEFLSEVELETPVFDELPYDAENSLLHQLQNDIQELRMPSENERAKGAENDGSIMAVSAHSPLRELQILKENLLQILKDHPNWQPHDIAVLTPNIEPYAPFIEGVFGSAQGGMQALPYSVSDVKLSSRQPFFYALQQVLDLMESRFEVDKVLALLESRAVLARFELTENDVPLLKDAVQQMNVYWGLDAEMRGAEDNLFTWQQAVDRMTLGWMLPEQDGALWHGISAWHSDINHLNTFSRFTAFLDTLGKVQKQWQQPAGVAEWTERVRQTVVDLFQAGESDQQAVQQLEQALAKWHEEAALAGFSGALSAHIAIRHISRLLDSENQAGFLRGGITFCSMVPMRSLPFKVLCLLGLNDGSFPRNTKAAVFDLIARHPKKGDRARRDDDRYLFLEALISAREILYLSYVGKKIESDEELAPSALFSELVDTVAAMTGESSKNLMENWVQQHPMQAFSKRYFDTNSDGIAGMRQDYAAALNNPQAMPSEFFTRTLSREIKEQAEILVYQQDFIAFWRNPVSWWLRHSLGWRKDYLAADPEAAEPFEPQHGESVADAYVEARRNRQSFEDVAAKLHAQSLMPSGELGRLWQEDYQIKVKAMDAALLQSRKLPPFGYHLTTEHGEICGSLSNLYEDGQIFFANKKLSYPQKVAMMLEHLLMCAAMPSEIQQYTTYIVSYENTECYQPVASDCALELIDRLLEYFRIGQTKPLPFVAKLNWQAAETYNKHAFKPKADFDGIWTEVRKEAAANYHGNDHAAGIKTYQEIDLVFGKSGMQFDDDLFKSLVKVWAAVFHAALPKKDEKKK